MNAVQQRVVPVEGESGLRLVGIVNRWYLLSTIILVQVLSPAWGQHVRAELRRTELTAVADLTITEGIDNRHAAENNGAATYLEIGTANRGDGFSARRGLLRFDLSSIPPNAKIRMALISLRRIYVEDSGGSQEQSPLLTAYRLLRPWEEQAGMAATWNQSRFGQERWSKPGADGEADRAITPTDFINPFVKGPHFTLDVTADVRDFVSGNAENFGWLLIGPEGANGRYFVRFNSREREVDETDKPRLILYWDERTEE